MDTKEQIKRDISIVDVASLYVDLKPAGKYYKGLCPFHTEKTPSFFVNPEKESFSCYGCNKFGDIFTMVQEMENLNFSEAIDFLIEKFNLAIKNKKYSKTESQEGYLRINQLALNYFRDNLLDSSEGQKALAYLQDRGINNNTMETFSLGYAQDKWDGLLSHLQKKSINIKQAVESGLLIENKNKIYDRFRGRIIFPIFSETGKILAFGGRTIVDHPSKYLNSPDTPLYKKSKNLYGLDKSKQFIREKKSAILVEGYFDLVSLYQHGVTNVVASLGTALGENQVYLLKRFTDHIYIFYDSDQAGISAAMRGIDIMLEQNVIPRIIALPEAMDPDDLIRKKGFKRLNKEMTEAQDGIKFIIKNISAEIDPDRPEQKSKGIQKIMNSINKIADPIIKEEYTKMVADFFRVHEKTLQIKKKFTIEPGRENQEMLLSPAERIFLECIVAFPELIPDLKELITKEILSVLKSKNMTRLLFKHYRPDSHEITELKEIFTQMTIPERIVLRKIFAKKEHHTLNREEAEQKIEASFYKFQDLLNKKKSREINQKIKLAEKENQREKIINLMTQKYKYVKRKYINVQED